MLVELSGVGDTESCLPVFLQKQNNDLIKHEGDTNTGVDLKVASFNILT